MQFLNGIMKYNLLGLGEKAEQVENWESFYIVYSVVVISGAARGLFFPSLWNLVQEMGGTSIDLGYVAATFGVGRFLATSPFGYMSDKYRPKIPLMFSHVILLLTSLLWANIASTKKIGLLYFCQFLLGFGSGTSGVTRSFIVEQTEPKKRTEVLAFLAALQYAGLTISSLFGSTLGNMGSKINVAGSNYWTYALPGYCMFLLSLYTLIALLSVFRNANEVPMSSSSKAITVAKEENKTVELVTVTNPLNGDLESNSTNATESFKSSTDISPTTPPTTPTTSTSMLHIIYVMIFLNISANGIMSVYETLVSKIGIQKYNMPSLTVGYLITGSGTAGFLNLLLFKSFWCVHFSDMQLMFLGFGVMIFSQIVIIALIHQTSYADFVTSTVLMYAIGYPIAKTSVLGAFSKIQKAGAQGAVMGWFATAAAFSRIIFPVMCSYLRNNAPFCVNMMVLVLSYAGIIILRERMSVYIEVKSDRNTNDSGVENSNQTKHKQTWVEYFREHRRGDKIQMVILAGCFIFAIAAIVSPSHGDNGVHFGEDDHEWHGGDADRRRLLLEGFAAM